MAQQRNSFLAVLTVLGVAPPVLGVRISKAPATEIDGGYFWPSIHGHSSNYTVSSFAGPKDLGKPTWTWHDERGLWSTIPVSTNIDDKKNIYLTVADGIRKFSPDGKLLWTYKRPGSETIHQAASLWKGRVFCMMSSGRAFALSMETGKEIWSTTFAQNGDGNYGQVAVHDGVVIAAGDSSTNLNRMAPSCCGDASHKLVALDAADGSQLWSFYPDIPVWASNPSFAEDGTFVFQNLEGTVHRMKLSDGSLIWKAGGEPGTWTDGSCMLGPNGIVYGVSSTKNGKPAEGHLTAYRFDDGSVLWRKTTPSPPNQHPAIGHVFGYAGLTVVQPMGMQCMKFQRMDVRAYDAETGEVRWEFEGPTLMQDMVAGDLEGYSARESAQIQTLTLPHPFGSTTIDAEGTVYTASETGHIFALRDVNGDGRILGTTPGEESVLDTRAAFVGSSGPAHAPGLFALGNLNSLYVWRY